jgi:hypothetical protein
METAVFTFALDTKPRRSRRLAGLEPDATPAQEPEVFCYKPQPQPQAQSGFCSRFLGVVGGALATITLGRTIVAIASAPGYFLF